MALGSSAKSADSLAAECPVCGGILQRVVYLGEGDNPMSDLEAGAEAEIDVAWWSYVH